MEEKQYVPTDMHVRKEPQLKSLACLVNTGMAQIEQHVPNAQQDNFYFVNEESMQKEYIFYYQN